MRWYCERKNPWPDPVYCQLGSLPLGFPVHFRSYYPRGKVLSVGRRAGLLFAAQHSPGHGFLCPDHHQADRQDAQAAPGCYLSDEYSGGYCRLDIYYNVYAKALKAPP